MADYTEQILTALVASVLPSPQAQGPGAQTGRGRAGLSGISHERSRSYCVWAASNSARITPSDPPHRTAPSPAPIAAPAPAWATSARAHRRQARDRSPHSRRPGPRRRHRRPGPRAPAPQAQSARDQSDRTRHPRPGTSHAQFVGTYFERDGQGYVRVDGTVFSHSIHVGDPGAKGAKPDDKVVFEMLRFPSPEERGEGVITEVLGPRGQPGVDTLSVIRAYNLPDVFPEDALEEAREAADAFREDDLERPRGFHRRPSSSPSTPSTPATSTTPSSLTRDEATGHWELTVHIADVGHFAPPGGPLDREARRRATSVYLPQRVIPMFPEIISNGLASLQQDRLRYVKSVVIDFTPRRQEDRRPLRQRRHPRAPPFQLRSRCRRPDAHPLADEPTPEQTAAAPPLDAEVLRPAAAHARPGHDPAQAVV